MSKSDIEEEEGNDSEEGLERIGNQLGAYERQLRRQLQNLDAKIDSYHFSIQKEEEGAGITIDPSLRTTIRMKQKVLEE